MNSNTAPVFPTHTVRPTLKSTWPAYVILVFSLLATIGGWQITKRYISSKVEAVFKQQSDAVLNSLTSSLDQQKGILLSLQELYGSSIQVVRDVFELFATVPQKMYPSIHAIGYAPVVETGNETAFASYAMNEGYQAYSIHPLSDKPERFPIEYLVPTARRAQNLGFDLHSDANIGQAIEAAKAKNAISASAPFLSSTDSVDTFFLLAPVFTAYSWSEMSPQSESHFGGICFIQLRIHEFFQSTVEKATDTSRIALGLYLNEESERGMLYSVGDTSNTLMTQTENIRLGNERWTLVFYAKPGITRTINMNLPWISLFGGVAISILFFAFIYSLMTSRHRALQIAEQMTRSQRRIVDSSKDIICVLGFDGMWKSMNPASTVMLHFRPDEMVGKYHLDYVFAHDRDMMQATLASAPNEVPIEIEARYLDKRGMIRWLDWSITSSQKDNLIYMIGKDITEKKHAEHIIQIQNKQLELAGLIADRENVSKELSLREQSKDFRTQLTSILGFLELVLSDDITLTHEEIRDFVAIAHESSKELLSKVEQIMNVSFAKTNELRFTFAPITALELFERATRKLILSRERLGHSFPVEPQEFLPKLEPVSIDSEKFEEVLGLYFIALLQTHEQGRILASMTRYDEKHRIGLSFNVETNEQEAEEAQKIVELNADPRNLKDNEAFHLAIAKKFCEIMDIEVSVQRIETGVLIELIFPLMEK